MRIGKVEKLVPNLEDKKTFVVKNQKFELGIKAWFKTKTVHRVIIFRQTY